MKKLIIILLILSFKTGFTQLTLEHTYANWMGYAEVAPNEWNYYYADASNIYIYNISHALIKTIPVPAIPGYTFSFQVVSGSYYFTPGIKWLSKTLFNTDTNYEYMASYFKKNAGQTMMVAVYNDAGSRLLFDSIGWGGSNVPPAIINTSNGIKLVLNGYSSDYTHSFYYEDCKVYGLGGNFYPSSADGFSSNALQTQLPYPNPSASQIHLPYILPQGNNTAKMIVINTAGQTVYTCNVGPGFNDVLFGTAAYPQGIYYYYIVTDNYKSEPQKFVIIRQ